MVFMVINAFDSIVPVARFIFIIARMKNVSENFYPNDFSKYM